MSDETLLGDATAAADIAVDQFDDEAADEALLESLLVEEVSIDGMCGVY